MKQISILLTKYNDWTSTFVYYITGRGYTHASIALEEDPDTYYSFNYRGFAVETVAKHKRRGVRYSRSLEVCVSDETYEQVKSCIEAFREKKERLYYTRLGAVCCAMRLPLHFENAYFCSYFVAEVLERSGAAVLPKRPWRYTPNHFIGLLEQHPGFQRTVMNPV